MKPSKADLVVLTVRLTPEEIKAVASGALVTVRTPCGLNVEVERAESETEDLAGEHYSDGKSVWGNGAW